MTAPDRSEGGPEYLNWNLSAADEDLSAQEHVILESLGAAVVRQWSDLPRDIQKSLFATATGSPSSDEVTPLKTLMAQFLHGHNRHP